MNSKLFISISICTCVYFLVCTNFVKGEWKKIENPCLCKEFRCANGLFCLHAERVCNGVKDCPDGEDERNDFTPGEKSCTKGYKQKCAKSEFKGKFGDCIPIGQVCDGHVDSWGGVDEAIDFCTWVHSDSNATEPHSTIST